MVAGFGDRVHIATLPGRAHHVHHVREDHCCDDIAPAPRRKKAAAVRPRRATGGVAAGDRGADGRRRNHRRTGYKCPQAGGAVLYADYPCKGGAVVDIRPGVAAPDASEQLARARDELDRAAARRQAIDAAAELRRREIDWQRESVAAQTVDTAAYASDTSYLPAYGYYAPYVNPRAHRPNVRPRFDPPRVAERRVPAVIRRP